MHVPGRIRGAIQSHWPPARLLKIDVSSLLALVALSLGWIGLQLFLASVV